MPKYNKLFFLIFLIFVTLFVFYGRGIDNIRAQSLVAALKTLTSDHPATTFNDTGYFYVPALTPAPGELEVVFLFNDPGIEGDQSSAVVGVPDCSKQTHDQAFAAARCPLSSEGDANWNYMCDVVPDRKIDIRDISLMVGAAYFGTCINNLTGVTIEFRDSLYNPIGAPVGLDALNRALIPAGADNFTIGNPGPIGAYVLFYAGTPNLSPVASFTKSAASINIGDVVNFDATASYDPDGSIVSYNWSFGDGSTTTGVTTSHAWAAAGNYIITLIVTDDDGASNSTTSNVNVAAPPPICTNLSCQGSQAPCSCGTATTTAANAWCCAASNSIYSTQANCQADAACMPPPPPPPVCTCNSWLNNVCGAGGCNASELNQSRTCNPPGCDTESRCISNPVCASGGIVFGSPLGNMTLEEIIDAILNFIFWLAVVIFPLIIMVAALYLLTSGGDPQKIVLAKKIILWAFVGFVIALLSKGIPALVRKLLGG